MRVGTLGVAALAAAAVAAAGLVAPTVAAAEEPPAALLTYAFDDAGAPGPLAASSVVPDTGSASHPGTVANSGASLVTGLSGAAGDLAVSLPGGASTAAAPHVVIAPGLLPTTTADLTMSAWVRWSGSGSCTWPYTLGSSVTNHVLFTTSCGSRAYGAIRSGTEVRATGTAPAAAARWTHLAVVVDGGTSVSTYVDGLRVGHAATTHTAAAAAGAAAFSGYLGKSFYSADAYFNGVLDDVRVYDAALTAEQLLASAAAPAGGAEVLLGLDAAALSVPDTAYGDLALPAAGARSTIEWGSSDAGVIDPSGTVNRPDVDTTVTLTATLTLAGTTRTQDFSVLVPAVTTDELAASLVIPGRIAEDLQSEVLGREVTWTGAPAWVSDDGTVTRPARGADPVQVTLTASIAGRTLTGATTILPQGDDALTYVSAGGNVFLGEDLLSPPDSRRSDALRIALGGNDTGWTPLNRGQALLYVRWNGDQKSEAGKDWQMGSPTLFRDADGDLGVVASANNNRTGVYLWDTAADGTTFTGERYLTVTTRAGAVRDPRVVWDAATERYKIFWRDGAGGAFVSTFATLSAGATLESEFPADLPRRTVGGALPAQAAEASVFALSDTETAALAKAYGALRNTGVDEVDVSVDADAAVADALPGSVAFSYSDGTTKDLGVEWDAADVAAAEAAAPGATVEVEGTVLQNAHDYPFISERADPHIFYNEDDGYYYAAGSYYPVTEQDEIFTAATSYGALGLRRATTIEGLAAAPEHLLRESKVGDRWGGFFWAPEIHKINGTWYIVVGAHDYGTDGRQAGEPYTWCSNTILIPFTGTSADIEAGKFLDPAYWGGDSAITILTGAPSFDVNYYFDDARDQGYWVLPNTPSGARISIARAATGPGVVPAIQGARIEVDAIQWPWEYGVQDGSITAANPEGTDQGIVEGPYLFSHGDQMYLSYSGATVDKYYTLGLLKAAKGADPMDPATWEHIGYPLLTSYDTDEGEIGGAPHVGGGHNSIVTDEYGNLALVYHARPYPDPHQGQPGAGGLFDPDRHTAVKSINVRADGTLDLAITAAQEVAPENRTVTATVTISGAASPIDVGVAQRCVAGKVVQVVSLRNTGTTTLAGSVATTAGTRAYAGLAPGRATSIAFSTRVPAVPAGTVTVSASSGATTHPDVTQSHPSYSCG